MQNFLKVLYASLMVVMLLELVTISHIITEDIKYIKEYNLKVNNTLIHTNQPISYKMRITGYISKPNAKTALGEKVQSGYTCAVSPDCIFLLGKKIYVKGYGIRRVNDLTADWLDDKFGMCTIDLATTKEGLKNIGCTTRDVVVLE